MQFEILVEDQSGKKTLEILVPKIIGGDNTFRIHSYKGIGRISPSLRSSKNAKARILLDQLPKLLRGFGQTFDKYPEEYPATVIVVCDLDDKCLKIFKKELFEILDDCNPKPEARFCIAIEEGEAWFLGDIPAIKAAYTNVKDAILNKYVNDSICGTWECLADALYGGGSLALKNKGWQIVGAEKSKWAEEITPHMDVENNASASFCYFREKIRELIE